ncbi:MAG TPA: toprim domain-containing protein [Acidimicrobiales bacterium]|nr:toprim domain-containing protein [Acidimicrobiales bacterium]
MLWWVQRVIRRRGCRLRSRAIDVSALEGYTGRTEVGAAPGGRGDLVRHLRSASFADEELVDAGLAHRAHDGGPVTDFFRSRVLVPLRGSEGTLSRIVGRDVGDARWAKYKNSPRTVLYDKSVDLYQPLPLPERPQGGIVVVEGTMDPMAIAAAAVAAGVARLHYPATRSGKELSALQVARLSSTSHATLVLALDGDHPGREARGRLAGSSPQSRKEGGGGGLADGADPASWLALYGTAGPDSF